MNYQAVIFDLDGTLVDTLQDLTESVNFAMSQLGLPGHSVSAIGQMVGDGNRMLISRALPADREDLFDRAFALQRKYYQEHMLVFSRPYPGIPEAVNSLKAGGLNLAVLSNKPDRFTQALVTHFFPEGTFKAVMGQRENVPLKPDPAGALLIARQWGCPFGNIAYLGDTATDMQTARRAGMFAIGVTWGFRGRDELAAHGADILIDDPAQIAAVVL